MSDRRRYDSAMFWLAFGTAAAVIGLALMTIAVTRSARGDNLLTSFWFDGGLGLLFVGALLLLWALVLYLRHRRGEATALSATPGGPGGQQGPAPDTMTEAVRGYYAEREKLIDVWDRQQRSRRRKSR